MSEFHRSGVLFNNADYAGHAVIPLTGANRTVDGAPVKKIAPGPHSSVMGRENQVIRNGKPSPIHRCLKVVEVSPPEKAVGDPKLRNRKGSP